MSRTTRRAAAAQETLFVEPAKGELKEGDKLTGAAGSGGRVVHVPKQKKQQQVAVVEQPSARMVPQNLLQSLFAAISDPKVDPPKMHALLDVRDRLMQEQAKVEFFRAYIRLQGKLPSINKDGLIDQGETKSGRKGSKSRYATYENINAVTKPILAEEKFGLLLLPDVGPEGHGVIIRGQLGYVCETQYGDIVHIERCTIAVPPEVSGSKNAAQGVGSSLSYGKRYGAIALLNLVSHAPADRDTDAGGPKKPGNVQEAQVVQEFLTPKEHEQLEKAILDAGITVAFFCERWEVDELSLLSPKLFPEALAACVALKAKRNPNG